MIEKSSSKSKTLLLEEAAHTTQLVAAVAPEKRGRRCGTEVLLLTSALLAMAVLALVLHANMDGDWTADPVSRTRVLVLAFVMFCISILVCYYTTNVLGIRTCSWRSGQTDLYEYTTNRVHLLSYDLPPSYDSVKCNIQYLPPPSYDEISIQIARVTASETGHHKGTG